MQIKYNVNITSTLLFVSHKMFISFTAALISCLREEDLAKTPIRYVQYRGCKLPKTIGTVRMRNVNLWMDRWQQSVATDVELNLLWQHKRCTAVIVLLTLAIEI